MQFQTTQSQGTSTPQVCMENTQALIPGLIGVPYATTITVLKSTPKAHVKGK